MTPMSKAIPVDHARAEKIAGRTLPVEGKYHVRIWIDGTCVLWHEVTHPGWNMPKESLIVMKKNLILENQ